MVRISIKPISIMECQPRDFNVAQWSCLLRSLQSSSNRDLALPVVDITHGGLQQVQSSATTRCTAEITDSPSGNPRYCWYCWYWWKKSCTSWYVVYLCSLCLSHDYRYYRVLYIPGGCLGFQPSTVVQKSGQPLGRWKKHWDTGVD